MLEGFKKTLKSPETEDWLDYRLIRPLSYLWALLFAKLGIHPNTVTIMSMIIGAGSAYFFMQPSFYYGSETFGANGSTIGLMMNIIAILLLLWADVFDCTDGQLARLTDKKSPLGRILDGVAGFVWFTPIYLCLDYRFYLHHSLEFGWLGIADSQQNTFIATAIVVVLSFISGLAGLAGQQRLADYYIQIHLFLLKGEKGSELDNSERQQEIYDEMPKGGGFHNWLIRTFQKSYILYTQKQEARTPQFQRLLGLLKEKYGSAGNMPAEIREELHRYSKGIMGWNACLTFNFRELWFVIFCLLDVPALTFLYEIILMGLLTLYINKRHEAFCKKVADKIS